MTLLDQLETLASQLRSATTISHATPTGNTELLDLRLVESMADLRSVFSSMQDRALQSIDGFACGEHPPQAEPQAQSQRPALDRGVKYRVVYDPTVFEREDLMRGMLDSVRQGEEARMSTNLTTRLLIRDQEEFLIHREKPAKNSHLAVHFTSPFLAEFFNSIFENVWDSALPVVNRKIVEGSLLTSEEVQILRLVAAGQKDESVARVLGVSVRTLQRKIQSLQKNFGASSRFQLGAMSAKYLAPKEEL